MSTVTGIHTDCSSLNIDTQFPEKSTPVEETNAPADCAEAERLARIIKANTGMSFISDTSYYKTDSGARRHKGTKTQRKPAINGLCLPAFFVSSCLCVFVPLTNNSEILH